MVYFEKLRWVGRFGKIAAWLSERHWEIRDCSMQLLPGNSSKKGARQGCQRMPQLSQFRGGFPVAMLNDGRIE